MEGKTHVRDIDVLEEAGDREHHRAAARIGDTGAEAGELHRPGGRDACGDDGRGLARGGAQFAEREGRHFDVQVDAVERLPGDAARGSARSAVRGRCRRGVARRGGCRDRGSFISCHPAASPSEDANPGRPATPKIPRPWASTSAGRAWIAASITASASFFVKWW
jgi:hypothetical protein